MRRAAVLAALLALAFTVLALMVAPSLSGIDDGSPASPAPAPQQLAPQPPAHVATSHRATWLQPLAVPAPLAEGASGD